MKRVKTEEEGVGSKEGKGWSQGKVMEASLMKGARFLVFVKADGLGDVVCDERFGGIDSKEYFGSNWSSTKTPDRRRKTQRKP